MIFACLISLSFLACEKDNTSNCSHLELPTDLCVSQSALPTDEESQLSRLYVSGNQIVDIACNPVVLKGVVIPDPYFLFEDRDDPITSDYFLKLKEDWNVNIVRIPIHPGLFLDHPDYLTYYVDPIIEWCNQHDIYALVGYHAHGNIQTGKSEMPSWRFDYPWTGNPYNSDKTLTYIALVEIISRYQNKPWVLYSLFNEPAYISWEDWKPEAEALIDHARTIDSNAVIMIPGVDWGYDMSGSLCNSLNRENIIYELHPYPWKGDAWYGVVDIIDQVHPVFLGEWGFADPSDVTYAQELTQFCNQKGIGWCAWIYDHEWSPSLYTAPDELTLFGLIVRDELSDD